MESQRSWKDPEPGPDLYWRLPVAVYGTLRTGLHNYARYLHENPAVVTTEPGVVFGYELHELAMGLPIVVPAKGASVVVEVVTISGSHGGDDLRDALDQLEGFRPYQPSGIYTRVLAEVVVGGRTEDCWLYAAGDAITPGELGEHSRITGGDWVDRWAIG